MNVLHRAHHCSELFLEKGLDGNWECCSRGCWVHCWTGEVRATEKFGQCGLISDEDIDGGLSWMRVSLDAIFYLPCEMWSLPLLTILGPWYVQKLLSEHFQQYFARSLTRTSLLSVPVSLARVTSSFNKHALWSDHGAVLVCWAVLKVHITPSHLMASMSRIKTATRSEFQDTFMWTTSTWSWRP